MRNGAGLFAGRGEGVAEQVVQPVHHAAARSVREFAAQIGGSLSTAWKVLREDPRAPVPFKVGGLTRILQQDIDAYLERLKQEAIDKRAARRESLAAVST